MHIGIGADTAGRSVRTYNPILGLTVRRRPIDHRRWVNPSRIERGSVGESTLAADLSALELGAHRLIQQRPLRSPHSRFVDASLLTSRYNDVPSALPDDVTRSVANRRASAAVDNFRQGRTS